MILFSVDFLHIVFEIKESISGSRAVNYLLCEARLRLVSLLALSVPPNYDWRANVDMQA